MVKIDGPYASTIVRLAWMADPWAHRAEAVWASREYDAVCAGFRAALANARGARREAARRACVAERDAREAMVGV